MGRKWEWEQGTKKPGVTLAWANLCEYFSLLESVMREEKKKELKKQKGNGHQ